MRATFAYFEDNETATLDPTDLMPALLQLGVTEIEARAAILHRSRADEQALDLLAFSALLQDIRDLTIARKLKVPSDVFAAFVQFDYDRSGSIEEEELRQ